MTHEPLRWLGDTVGFWIQTCVLAVSAVGGIWIILSRGKQEGKRATVDLVNDQRIDNQLLEARTCIREMHDRKEPNLAKFLEDPKSKEYQAIFYALNTYEFVAVGIRTKAFNEKTYKRLRYSTFIKDWQAFQGFVAEFRRQSGKDTLFQDSEWLYRRWQRSPLKLSK